MPLTEESAEIVILEIQPVDEENENYVAVENEEILDKVYGIFKERGYHAIIMPAGLRGSHHLVQLAGADVTFSITTRVQEMVLADDPERVERIDEPVAEDIMENLKKMPEFLKAYEPDGMKKEEYITFGVMQKLLSQFTETGWAPLEVYKSNRKSARWI